MSRSQLFGVKNTGTYDYTEKYRGETITVKAGQTIKMPRSKAVSFLGTPVFPKKDGMGNQIPGTGKTLTMVWPKSLDEKKIFTSERNNERYLSEEDMVEQDSSFETEEETTSLEAFSCPICNEECETEESFVHHVKGHDDTNRNNKRRKKSV